MVSQYRLKQVEGDSELIGSSTAMDQVKRLIDKVDQPIARY